MSVAYDPNNVTNGFQTVERGVNSVDPEFVAANQLYFAVNATMRGGYVECRPGFSKKALVFESEETEENFKTGMFQGASYFSVGPCIVAAIGGRVFRITLGIRNFVQDISIPGDLNPSNRRQAWMIEAERFLIIQDGQSRPIFYDGASCRRAQLGELPPGTCMEYAWGRVWMGLPDGQSFVAGDLVGGPSGTPTYNYRDAVLKFTENDYLNEGGAFAVPVSAGQIRAIRATANLDTSLGQGPVLVFATKSVFSVNAPVDRAQWKNVTFPIQTVALKDFGAQAQNSTIIVNGDVWYRSFDGVRSFIVARREITTWGNTPMSREMNRVLPHDDETLLNFGSSVLFDNRLLMTMSPARNFDHGIYHRGLAVINFDLVSSMAEKQPPAWEGMWTGLNFLHIFTGEFGTLRCFAFALNQDDEIVLYEISKSERFDNIQNRIDWFYESASWGFDGSRVKLESGEIWTDRLTSQCDLSIQFRPDQYPGYLDWHSWTECADVDQCEIDECNPSVFLREQYRPRKLLPEPEASCESATDKPLTQGWRFQVKVLVTGFCRCKKLLLVARQKQERAKGECADNSECYAEAVCDSNPFTYTISE